MDFTEVWKNLAIQGPLVAFLAYVWFTEREERRLKEKQKDDLQERTLNALNTTANAVQGLKDILTVGPK
jgi:hypothetical protein